MTSEKKLVLPPLPIKFIYRSFFLNSTDTVISNRLHYFPLTFKRKKKKAKHPLVTFSSPKRHSSGLICLVHFALYINQISFPPTTSGPKPTFEKEGLGYFSVFYPSFSPSAFLFLPQLNKAALSPLELKFKGEELMKEEMSSLIPLPRAVFKTDSFS